MIESGWKVVRFIKPQNTNEGGARLAGWLKVVGGGISVSTEGSRRLCEVFQSQRRALLVNPQNWDWDTNAIILRWLDLKVCDCEIFANLCLLSNLRLKLYFGKF